ncbi:MAG: motility protein A [Nitrospirae bacterium]|nr:MAG: motility protein A [Nitrospirota bacterium]
MDLATLLGTCSAFGLVAVAILLGVGFRAFLDLPSLLIVVGGTLGVAFMNYPFRQLFAAARAAAKVVLDRRPDPVAMLRNLVEIAQRARRDGLFAVGEELDKVKEPFLRKALEMVVDGVDQASIEAILEEELELLAERHANAAEVFTSLAAYAPAMGLIGTLIGLVGMLQNMSDPSSIGPAMAVALLTTFYGAILANMVFQPAAGKLRLRSQEEVRYKELILRGVIAVANGENPRVLEQKLHVFLAPKARVPVVRQPGQASPAGAKPW